MIKQPELHVEMLGACSKQSKSPNQVVIRSPQLKYMTCSFITHGLRSVHGKAISSTPMFQIMNPGKPLPNFLVYTQRVFSKYPNPKISKDIH